MGLLDSVDTSKLTGSDVAEELEREASNGFERTAFLTSELKSKNDSVIIRLLMDRHEWVHVMQHQFAETKAPPRNASDAMKQNWPSKMGAVCRRTKAFQHLFDGCFLCDNRGHRAQPRTWALAVQREPVLLDSALATEMGMTLSELKAEYPNVREGEELGMRDVEITVDERDENNKPTGNRITKKKILVVNMAMKNFFSAIKGYSEAYKGILDRDLIVVRTGEGKDTDYSITPLDKIEVDHGGKDRFWSMLLPELEEKVADDGTVTYVETGREVRDAYFDDSPKLFDVIESALDDTRYHKFFDDTVDYLVPEKEGEEPKAAPAKAGAKRSFQAPKRKAASAPAASESGGGEESAPASTGAPAPAAAKLQAMRDKALAKNKPAAAKEPEPQSEPESEGADEAAEANA